MVALQQRDISLLQKTALHPQLQTALFHHANQDQKKLLAKIPNITPKLQHQLIQLAKNEQHKHLTPWAAINLASSAGTTAENLQKMWDETNQITTQKAEQEKLKAAIIKNPNCPEKILQTLPQLLQNNTYQHMLIQIAITERTNLDPQIINQLTQNTPNQLQPELTKWLNSHTPITKQHLTESLTELNNKNQKITQTHQLHLQHQNTPADILAELAKTRSDTWEYITQNPSCEPDTLQYINEQLKHGAEHTNKPWNYRHTFLGQKQALILAHIAEHQNTPADILTELALSEIHHEMITSKAQKNPGLNLQTIQNILTDHEDQINYAIYHNPNLPPETLTTLIQENLPKIYDLNFMLEPLLKQLPTLTDEQLEKTIPGLTQLPAPYNNIAAIALINAKTETLLANPKATNIASPDTAAILWTNQALNTNNVQIQIIALQITLDNQKQEQTDKKFNQTLTKTITNQLQKNHHLLSTSQIVQITKMLKEHNQTYNFTQTTKTPKTPIAAKTTKNQNTKTTGITIRN